MSLMGSREQMDGGFYLSHGEGLFIAIRCFPEHERVGDFREQKARAICLHYFLEAQNSRKVNIASPSPCSTQTEGCT